MLTIARAPDKAIWVGTYGLGIFVLRPGRGMGDEGRVWERIRSSSDTAAHSISWDFVHAFGFGPRGQIWYGTVGNGWGLSTDGGKTWKNWEFGQLGPEWQYVTPNGIITRGDTTYIATADGIKLTWDDGQTWRVITDSIGATTARDSVFGRLPSQYVIGFASDGRALIASTVSGFYRSLNGARTWSATTVRGFCADSACRDRLRRIEWTVSDDSLRFLMTIDDRCRFTSLPNWCRNPRYLARTAILSNGTIAVLEGTPVGLVAYDGDTTRDLRPAAPVPPTVVQVPTQPKHTWFRRPIALTDQPYIDQTYRFGSTMGGNFQPHQGVEFNTGDGTPVHAIGDGVVVYSGPAEQGALTVAIRHDRRLPITPGRRPGVSRDTSGLGSADPGAVPRGGYHLYSAYYHNSRLLAHVGQRLKAGDVIALVGNTGRATNDHLHLEVHASPFDSTRLIVDPAVRYPPHNTNPELWIEPLPGTGMVAGQVWDSAGQPLYQARIYGLVKREPQETPFSFIETYGPRNHSDPIYQEHFGISDVSPGEYVLGVEIGGTRVFRRVKVEPGKLTWVVFSPVPKP